MFKYLRNIFFACLLAMAAPMTMNAAEAIEIIDQEVATVTISVKGNVLHIANANGQMLYVYNVTGVRMMSIKVEGSDRRLELNLPKGCYIVKVGNTVRKISVK